jgi:hypothetical protein
LHRLRGAGFKSGRQLLAQLSNAGVLGRKLGGVVDDGRGGGGGLGLVAVAGQRDDEQGRSKHGYSCDEAFHGDSYAART